MAERRLRRAASALILAVGAASTALPSVAATTPAPARSDARIRTATYDPNQVFTIETDRLHATTIHFGEGERFTAVIVGDTEAFQVDPIPELGNVLTIKPHVAGAATNMTVLTNRREYSFHLREGARPDQFFEVKFVYPNERRARANASSQSGSAVSKGGFQSPRNFAYSAAGEGPFRPSQVYDDGRHTYFVFAETARQPAIFAADARGRERSVNQTTEGNTVRVRGVNDLWTLRIGDEAICIRRDATALTVGN